MDSYGKNGLFNHGPCYQRLYLYNYTSSHFALLSTLEILLLLLLLLFMLCQLPMCTFMTLTIIYIY